MFVLVSVRVCVSIAKNPCSNRIVSWNRHDRHSLHPNPLFSPPALLFLHKRLNTACRVHFDEQGILFAWLIVNSMKSQKQSKVNPPTKGSTQAPFFTLESIPDLHEPATHSTKETTSGPRLPMTDLASIYYSPSDSFDAVRYLLSVRTKWTLLWCKHPSCNMPFWCLEFNVIEAKRSDL